MLENIKFENVDFNPFGDTEILKVAGLVDAQKEGWLSCKIGGPDASLSYNESISLRLNGPPKEHFLEQACQILTQRHEALRMIFAPNGKQFMVTEAKNTPLHRWDWSGLDAADRGHQMADFVDGEASTEFDLQNGPLARFTLIKLAEEVHHFTITAHHLVCDGWSFGVMFEEFASIYNALFQQVQISLPDPISFSQYASEMEAFTLSEEYTKTEEYWKSRFSPLPNPLDLPTDKPRPKQRTYLGRRDDFFLDKSQVAQLKELAKKNNTSLVNTVMAAFEIFLYKITGQEDIVLGLPAAGQAATDNLVLVGHCVNLLPIRATVNPEISFGKYLSLRKSQLLDDYDHQQYTFGNLVKILKIPRDTARIPLVPVVFNIDMGMDSLVKFKDLEHILISNPRKYENFEIFLNLTSQADELVFEWSCNANLFSQETIAEWMAALNSLFQQVIADPSITIGGLSLNKERVLASLQEWNNTQVQLPVENSFLEIFWQQSASNPDTQAYVANGKEFSYAQLRKLASQMAFSLKNLQIGQGDVVGIMLDRNEKLLPLLLGVLELGATYLPLDPNFPEERIAYMLQDASAKLLVTEPHYQDRFKDTLPQWILGDVKEVNFESVFQGTCPKGDQLAYILYTSGSTGKPKGVKVSHHNLLNFLVGMQQSPGIRKGDRLLAITTVSFDIAGLELFLPLTAGATVVLASQEESKDGRLLLKTMRQQAITIMQATPATWRMLLLSGWVQPYPMTLLCGGEALTQDLAQNLLNLVGPFWNVYGPTETTVWSSIKNIQNAEEINIGRPIANTQIYILDQNLQPCLQGVVGEICIGGWGVAQGYHNRPDLTQEKFVTDIFSNLKDTKIYRTGDLGKFLPNGEIVCLGRMDFQVKIRGYRIELGEIEAQLNQMPNMKQAAVQAVEISEGNLALVAYLVPKISKNPQEFDLWIQEIRSLLKNALPEYMVPTEWMVLDQLPLTNNNKVDRKSLPKPETGRKTQIEPEHLPQSRQEKLVAAVWEKVLQRKSLHLESDFFDLGGHSLAALEVLVLLENETGIKLPVNSIFRFPNLRAFVGLLDPKQQGEAAWKSLVSIKPSGKKIPLFLIHGAGANVTSFFGLAKHFSEEQPVYGIQSKGLDGKEEPLHTIEEMASFYLEEIRKVCPKGPFHVGGQSFGAYVAFEMAKQMKSKGQSIGKVFLFDVTAYQSETIMTGWEKVKLKLNHQIEKRVVDVKLAVHHPDSFRRMKESSFTRKKGFVQRWFGLDKDKNASSLFNIIEKIRNINHQAMDNYVLSRFDGEIILIKAKIKTFLVEENQFYGWKPYAGLVIPIGVEGDHNSMIDDAQLVGNFAANMQAVMDACPTNSNLKDLDLETAKVSQDTSYMKT